MTRFSFKKKKTRNYFEGWYLRITDVHASINIALIFAVTYYDDDPHAFLQIFDGTAGTNKYVRFPLKTFSYRDNTVKISSNELSENHVKISVPSLRLEATFSQTVQIKKRSAMGWLSKMPLECYQEVILMDCNVTGSIRQDNKTIALDGKGYMEKTYGRRFPDRWFWLAANHFNKPIAITLAGGSVPFLKFKPFGFFLILRHGSEEWAFGLYNRAKIKILEEKEGISFFVKKGKYHVHLLVTKGPTTTLVGPDRHGAMTREVPESISANVAVKFSKGKTIIFEDQSDFVGFEWMFTS